MRKRRTREHIIADLSVNHVERHALLAGYTVARKLDDYGIDLVLTTYNNQGEIEDGAVLFQLKATDSLRLTADGSSILFTVSSSDLEFWILQVPPLMLIIYDAQADVAYWLYIQAYFQRQPGFDLSQVGRTVTVRIPVNNIVNQNAMQSFARFQNRVFQQTQQVVHDES